MSPDQAILGHRAGQPALGLHCALGRGRDLSDLVDAISPPLACLAPDLPGHGQASDWDGTGDFHDACMSAARDIAQGARIVLGHSLGATVALRFALESPGQVRALVLIEPVLFAAARGSSEAADHATQDARFAACLAAGDMAGAAAVFLALWGDGPPLATLPDAVQARFAVQMRLIAATGPALFEDKAGMLQPGRLERLSCPVLLVRGKRSPPITRAINESLGARLPNAESIEIADAGHMAPLVRPAQTGAAISGFLARVLA